ncbi:MAG: hypothetical protein LUD50_00560 [Clostridia bacterium]|nr:hypothetical protein [Clostridia bacterium]
MQITEDKKNRLIVAITVAAVVLIVIFIAVIIYQMVEMVYIKNRKKDIQDQIDYYQEQIDNSEDELEILQSEEYLKEYLMKQGYGWETIK